MSKYQKTRIFEYKGYVGIDGGTKLINDPNDVSQLGCIVDLNEVEISKEALAILKSLPKGHDDLGDIMCFGKTFAWLGGIRKVIRPDIPLEGDSDYTPSLLEKYVTDVEPTEEFKKFIDKISL